MAERNDGNPATLAEYVGAARQEVASGPEDFAREFGYALGYAEFSFEEVCEQFGLTPEEGGWLLGTSISCQAGHDAGLAARARLDLSRIAHIKKQFPDADVTPSDGRRFDQAVKSLKEAAASEDRREKRLKERRKEEKAALPPVRAVIITEDTLTLREIEGDVYEDARVVGDTDDDSED